MFGRTDSVATAPTAGHKTAVPALVSILAILHRKCVNKTRGLIRRTNFSTVHLLVLILCQYCYKYVLKEDVRSVIEWPLYNVNQN